MCVLHKAPFRMFLMKYMIYQWIQIAKLIHSIRVSCLTSEVLLSPLVTDSFFYDVCTQIISMRYGKLVKITVQCYKFQNDITRGLKCIQNINCKCNTTGSTFALVILK